jgi:hypothetical protein
VIQALRQTGAKLHIRNSLDFTHQLCDEPAPYEEPMTRIASQIALIVAGRPNNRPAAPLRARVLPGSLPMTSLVGMLQPKSLGTPE